MGGLPHLPRSGSVQRYFLIVTTNNFVTAQTFEHDAVPHHPSEWQLPCRSPDVPNGLFRALKTIFFVLSGLSTPRGSRWIKNPLLIHQPIL
jgi:hypothetical protein